MEDNKKDTTADKAGDVNNNTGMEDKKSNIGMTPSCMDKIKSRLASRYLWLALALIFIFGAFQYCTLSSLKESQDATIKKFSEHINKVDECIENLTQYAIDNMIGIQSVSSNIVVDSLIKVSVGKGKPLTESQHKMLVETIDLHFSHLSKVREDYEAKFLRDSVLLSAERILLSEQTKSMIELHLDKVEHEYSNITMWAAILTLVFLVFSFYSMFKLEEYIRQSKETVMDIKTLKKESIDYITNANKGIEEKTGAFDTAIAGSFANLEQKTSNIVDMYKEKLTITKEQFDSDKQVDIEEYKKLINNEFNLLKEDLLTRQAGLSTELQKMSVVIETYQQALEQLKENEKMSNVK